MSSKLPPEKAERVFEHVGFQVLSPGPALRSEVITKMYRQNASTLEMGYLAACRRFDFASGPQLLAKFLAACRRFDFPSGPQLLSNLRELAGSTGPEPVYPQPSGFGRFRFKESGRGARELSGGYDGSPCQRVALRGA